MSRARRLAVLAAAAGTALAVPAAALAHAYLIRTLPQASVLLSAPPSTLSMTYDEAVEPRFMIVSVTDAAGRQETAGRPARSPSNPDTIVTPLKRVPEGWYLVYWRAISADGHPVRGAFTFAVGPNAGPPPQFVIPSLVEKATKPDLVAFRFVVFLSTMAAFGLLALRLAIARPLVTRVAGSSLRRLTIAFAAALAVAVVATPVYAELATAQFALRSAFDLGDVVPLMRSSAFGRAVLDLELVLVLLAIAAAIAIRLDRPERARRSVAAMLSLAGAFAAAGAALFVFGLAGHAAQTHPRGLSLALDWVHLAAGSIWIGGLLGLLVLWWSLGEARTAGLAVCVPRFSNVALVSVTLLAGTGVGATIVRLPTLGSLWGTGYGQWILIKAGLLTCALGLAAVNLLRSKPRLEAAVRDPAIGARAAALLRRLVAGEVVIVGGAVFAAAVLTSLAPPPRALASIGHASAQVGPGRVTKVVRHGPYTLEFLVDPNKVAVPDSFAVRITKDGQPVRGAEVTSTFTMLDMEMQQLAYTFPERAPGLYERSAPALVMVGRWGLSFQIHPRGSAPFVVLLVDRARG